MATSRRSVGNPSSQMEDDDAFIYLFDRREGDTPEIKIPTGGLFTYLELRDRVREALNIKKSESFIIATTNREEIKDDQSWDYIDKGDTLYVLRNLNQELCAPAQQRVSYLPHYDTIVKGGMYEYYASEGQNPLPYAFAELIDNALAATSSNIGQRQIEIRLHIDDSHPTKNCIYVIDNGKGMNPRQLNNWAIYRLSKFIRKDKRGKVSCSSDEEDENEYESPAPVPLSLNSDISYFGVGGKQAIFFIGNATRMITKPKDSKDVHELTISKEEFQMKEKNQDAIYSGYIRNRKPADCSHVSPDDDTLRKLIKEEKNRDSFTVVEIHGINTNHMSYLKQHIQVWTRQLAHIYHYYIHGPTGNRDPDSLDSPRAPSPFKNIEIVVKLYRGQNQPRVINLRDIEDDMQTQFVRAAASTFEFKATVEGSGVVEGVLRYHPFLYDRETFPSDLNDPRSKFEQDALDEHDYAINDRPARGRRPMFECYWNGRLIPYTFIEDFDWCSEPKKSKSVPLECYNRVSGVLFTNDIFQVSTNKLTFIDLEMRLREKQTTYSRILNQQEKRTAIDREFLNWLKECHDLHDKQIHFSGFKGQHVRHDLPKHKQTPWAVYEQVEWDGKTFKKGQLVRITRTMPMLLGTIKRFLLYGDHEGDVYATGGDIEVIQEPRSLYDEQKIVPLSKLDRTASAQLVKKYIEEEEAKLPSSLVVSWPEGYEVKNNEKRPAGKTVGDIKVQIANKKGEHISKLPGTASISKKLLVELRVVWHSSTGDEVMVSHISQHGKNWPYWFRKMENIKNLGSHTLSLQAVLNESGADTYAGKPLPSHKIKFFVTEAAPEKFTVGLLDGPFRVGVPFQIPLEFLDEFNNPTKPGNKFKPELEANGLQLSYDSTFVKSSSLILKGVVAIGDVGTSSGKNFNMTVKIPDLERETQTIKIRLLPGPPESLSVKPEEPQEIENGSPVTYSVEVLDKAGNVTSGGKLHVNCRFAGSSGLPLYSLDCSSSGSGNLTGEAISVKKIKDSHTISAKIDLQGHKNVATVERTVKLLPSNRVADITVVHETDKSHKVTLDPGQEIDATAGDVVKNITFSLSDEAGRKIELDEKIASKIKVNWVPKIAKDIVLSGRLPDIKVPATVSDSKYCQVSIQDGSGVEFSFVINPKPSEPNQIKCKCSGSNVVRIGEVLESDIVVVIKDKFGNEITDLPKNVSQEFQVSGDSLKSDDIKVSYSKGSFVIRSVIFEGCKIGIKDLKISWRDCRDFVKIDVIAGPPCNMILPKWDLDQTFTVLNENKLPRPLVVQLVDEGGNITKVADVKVQVAKDPKLKVVPALMPSKTNQLGIVDFGVITVSGPRGSYDLQPRAIISGTTIHGPKLNISIQPDLTRPTEMKVEYDKKAAFSVAEKLPEFTVKILTEDGEPMKGAKASNISMKLWKLDVRTQNTPPSRAISFGPESVKQNGGVFVFKDRKLPEQSGVHNILITYYDGHYELFSNVITVDLKPGPPVQLGAHEEPGTPTVSNTRNASSRCVIRSLKLELRDEYGNSAGQGYFGKLNVEIMGPAGVMEIPAFVGGNRTLQMSINNGQCILANLTLAESTSGKDGLEYFLRCTVTCDLIPRNKSIPAYDIPFLFYNDAKKQCQMATLSKQRDDLQAVIRTYKSLFETSEQLVKELKISVHEATQEDTRLKDELRKIKIPMVQLQNLNSLDKLIQDKMKQRKSILSTQRRTCTLDQGEQDPDVLGKIGHLAQVQQEDIARVLSWHMSADMDCVVTLNNRKAKEIYTRTHGKQQVLPLDSIFKKNLPDWRKALPHIKYKPNWRPLGNPVYARNMLIFPQNEEQCKTVFGMLLGDTLILDNLDHANDYRQELVKYTHCPTILTREGDRIRSNGKFGGLMNKALPIEKLRGAVFGEPLPNSYHEQMVQIELLQNYRVAFAKSEKAKSELQEQVDHMKLPEMQDKYKECREAELQLKEVEQKLGVTMSSPRIPAAERDRNQRNNRNSLPMDTDGPSPSKRARTSTSATSLSHTLNGSLQGSASSTSVNSSTPTRASARIAHLSPVTAEDSRKRLRKT